MHAKKDRIIYLRQKMSVKVKLKGLLAFDAGEKKSDAGRGREGERESVCERERERVNVDFL